MNGPRIYLIGYRGTGKSTVGPLLAAKLGWKFADADAYFEERERMTIRECFDGYGERGFRERETACLRELVSLPNAVIATGGGVVLDAENRRLLRDTGFVVWLECDADAIFARTTADPTTAHRRPNLAGGGFAEIERMLDLRNPLYEQTAHLKLSTGRALPEATADAILVAWTGTR